MAMFRWVFFDVGNVLLDEDPLTLLSFRRHVESVVRIRSDLSFLDLLSQREARAAAAIRSRVDADREAGALPKIRIGITMGEVVVTAHSAGTGERLVTGDAVNLAARLQQYADPGRILVSEAVQRVLRNAAVLRSLPAPIALKGVPAPIMAWELVSVGPPHEREIRPTPFVGREHELL